MNKKTPRQDRWEREALLGRNIELVVFVLLVLVGLALFGRPAHAQDTQAAAGERSAVQRQPGDALDVGSGPLARPQEETRRGGDERRRAIPRELARDAAQLHTPAPSTEQLAAPSDPVPVIVVSITLPDGRLYQARLRAELGRRWSRFVNRSTGEAIMGAALHTRFLEGVLVCDLIADNGTLEADGSWKGVVRFSRYAVEVASRAGLRLITEENDAASRLILYSGPDVPWVPRRGAFLRFAIAAPGAEQAALDRLVLAGPTLIHPERGSIGPLETKLPDVSSIDYTGIGTTRHAKQIAAWKSGQPDPSVGLLHAKTALWQFSGEKAMAPGGDKIALSFGLHQNSKMLLGDMWEGRRRMDRERVWLHDSTGRQLTVFSFPHPVHNVQLKQGPGAWQLELPMFVKGTWDTYEYLWLPGCAPKPGDDVYFWLDGMDPSEALSHKCRVYTDLITEEEYLQSGFSRESIAAIFEDVRFDDLSDRPDEMTIDNSPGSWIPYSLTADVAAIARAPHNGFYWDRAEGHAGVLAGEMQRLGFNRKAWIEKFCGAVELAASPSGIVNRSWHQGDRDAVTGAWLSGFPWTLGASGDVVFIETGTQTFHSLILGSGYTAACRSIHRSAAELLVKLCTSIFRNPDVPPLPCIWSADERGPNWWLSTHNQSGQLIPISGVHGYGNGSSIGPQCKGDPQFGPHLLALCAEETGDSWWLTRQLDYWLPHASMAIRYQFLKERANKDWGGHVEGATKLWIEAHPAQLR